MKRIGLLSILLVFGSTNAHSGFIDVITGADMAGMEVTATFTDGSQSAATWTQLGVDSGQAAGTGWSLFQQGATLGNTDGTDILGEWVVTNNTGVAMSSMVIDAMAGNIVFDKFLTEVWTPGSNIGREFLAPNPGEVTGTYSDPFSDPDLFSTLTLSWANDLADGAEQRFLADTDQLTDTDQIPVPGTALLMLLGGLGLSMRLRSTRG